MRYLLCKRNQCFLLAFSFVPNLYPGTKSDSQVSYWPQLLSGIYATVLSVRTLLLCGKKGWCSACTMKTTRKEKNNSTCVCSIPIIPLTPQYDYSPRTLTEFKNRGQVWKGIL